ncbi:MAG TPA: hypothetical protein VKP61_00640 [Candidatus Acidoferrum sp.]|nr:hypothetical protein [Candidatus Acidoferrum sp.]
MKKKNIDRRLADLKRRTDRLLRRQTGPAAIKRRARMKASMRKLDKTMKKLRRVSKISERRIRGSIRGTDAILAKLERSAAARNKTLAKLARKQKSAKPKNPDAITITIHGGAAMRRALRKHAPLLKAAIRRAVQESAKSA